MASKFAIISAQKRLKFFDNWIKIRIDLALSDGGLFRLIGG